MDCMQDAAVAPGRHGIMSGRVTGRVDEALGVVVVVGAECRETVAWAAGWAVEGGQPLMVVAAGFGGGGLAGAGIAEGVGVRRVVREVAARHPGLVVRRRLAPELDAATLASLERRASSLVVDAEVAARASRIVGGGPGCPVLAVRRPEPDAPVLLAVGDCDGCVVPMAFAFAHADRVGAPMRVVLVWGDAMARGAMAEVRSRVEMFALCYPGVAVTVEGADGVPLGDLASGARLVVTGVGRGRPVRPWRAGLWDLARGPVALVPTAA